MKSLLRTLLYEDSKIASKLTIEQCRAVIKLANLRSYNITFHHGQNPGDVVLKYLDHAGCTVDGYKRLMTQVLNSKVITTYYRPQSKIAILIANADYIHLSRLATPVEDCELLASILQRLGFVTVLISNTTSINLIQILQKILFVVPENSYCIVFYAGHGCEICNTKCLLGVDCPKEDIELAYCVTENFILEELAKCKPDLCLMIMDMCRITLERTEHPKMYADITTVENYNVHNNLIICYTTKGSSAAYEAVEMLFTNSADIPSSTYVLQDGDSRRIVQGSSQYVKALCDRLEDGLDLSSLLDVVHEDLENALRKQTPIKVQCGVAKRSLYDTILGNIQEVRNKLIVVCEEYIDNCKVDLSIENDIQGTTILLDPL